MVLWNWEIQGGRNGGESGIVPNFGEKKGRVKDGERTEEWSKREKRREITGQWPGWKKERSKFFICYGIIFTKKKGRMDLWENIYYRFVKAFGTVIVEGAIVDMITGEVCFSTQKVRYAPVINGKNIFTDAYITKRYTITYDKITGRMSYSINNASYKSNRGDSPSMIVLNAQVAEMGSR